MKYLIQTMNKEGKIVFADIVDSPKEIRQVIDIDSRQAIRFKGDVFVYHDKLGDSVVTCISDERAQVLKAANKFPCNYEVLPVETLPSRQQTTIKKTIEELRAKYPYIPAYSFYMKSLEYWTVDQLRQAEAIGAPPDTYRVDCETYFTLSVIQNPELVAELMRYVDEERTKEYFMRHLNRLTNGEGHKQKIKLTHLQTETHWLSLDEVTVPLLIKWLKKEYLSKK